MLEEHPYQSRTEILQNINTTAGKLKGTGIVKEIRKK